MDRKRIEIIAGAAALVVFVAAAAFFFMGQAQMPDDQPQNSAITGVLVSSSAERITIETHDRKKKSYDITASTSVITVVASNETGKPLSQIGPGAQVYVQPQGPGSSVAAQVGVVPAPVPDSDPRGPAVSLSGVIVSTTTGSITVRVAPEDLRQIALDQDTKILSGVVAGQPGKTLADAPEGTHVQVDALATTGGLVARSVQLMLPI